MPAHKLFQRPVLTTHLSHESSAALGLGVPGDAMTFQTNFIAIAASAPTQMIVRTTGRQAPRNTRRQTGVYVPAIRR